MKVKVTENLKNDILENKVEMPKEFKPIKEKVLEVAKNTGKIEHNEVEGITYKQTLIEKKTFPMMRNRSS